MEKQKEEELYRHVQREIRKEQLLRKSKMPPRMQASIEEKSQIKQQMKKNLLNGGGGSGGSGTGGSRSSRRRGRFPSHVGHRGGGGGGGHDVPDFDRLYENFRQSMEAKKSARVTTVQEPFSFDRRRSVRLFFYTAPSFVAQYCPRPGRGFIRPPVCPMSPSTVPPLGFRFTKLATISLNVEIRYF